jgi:peptide-methionine (S)-S-oxide reductase
MLPQSQMTAAARWRALLLGICLSVLASVAIATLRAPRAVAAIGKPVKQTLPKPPAGKELATLAGGCFWSEEAIFSKLKGVDSVQSGYAGGSRSNPSYEDVETGTTGHAESVQLLFDPKIISYHDLLTIFLTTHNPTTLNRQGGDEGTQYRSAIFTMSPAQQATAKQVIAEVNASHTWPDPIVTEVTPYSNFYPSEAYHKNYYALHPDQGYCEAVIAPKLAHFRQLYKSRLK